MNFINFKTNFFKKQKAITVPVILMVIITTICFISILSKKSYNILRIEGHLSLWIPLTLFVFSILWRIYEIMIPYIHSKKIGVLRLNTIDKSINSLKTLYIFIFISVITFHFGVLGNLVGIQPKGGVLDNISGVAGVLPFADAKQYYAASMNLPIAGELSTYASRRPVHVIVLSIFNILTGFNYQNVFLIQATFLGICLGGVCTAIARWLGPSSAIMIWSMISLLSLDHLSSFMSEATGLWLSFIAVFLLIASIGRKSIWPIPLAISVLAMAFSARAGALFILPLLMIAGAFITFANKKSLRKYILVLLGSFILSASFPFFVYSIFDTRGASYQGNLSYILYDMAVGGTSWKQVQYDFPDELKSLKQEEQIDFIYKKAWDAFIESPMTLPISYFKRLKDPFFLFPVNHFSQFINNYTDRYITGYKYRRITPIFAIIFYSGILWLIFSKTLETQQKIIIIAIFLGYCLSMPFIWIGPAMRYHSTTWIFSVGIFSAFLTRKVNSSPTIVKSENFSIVCGVSIILFFYISACIIAFSARLNDLDNLKFPKQKIPRDSGYTHYLLLGPNTPFLKFIESESKTIRPNISINEFYSTSRMRRPDQQELFDKIHPNDVVFVGFDPRTGRHTFFTSNIVHKIPKQNKLFKATSTWIRRPFSMRIKKIKRVNKHPK